MHQLIIVFHVLAAVAIIGLIMVQQGKGADVGASFGAGASQTLFGGRGSGNALTRATAILAALFFITSFALALVAKNHATGAGLVDIPASESPAELPAKPVDDMPTVQQNAAAAEGLKPAEDMPANAPEQPQQ